MTYAPNTTWIALVSVEKSLIDNRYPDQLAVLEKDWLGASGWIAIDAPSDDEARNELKRTFEELGLRIAEISDLEEIHHLDQYREFDEHLWKNVLGWEEGHLTVWGTLHGYYAEGEA